MLVKKGKTLSGDNKPLMIHFADCLGIDAATSRSIVYSAGIRSAANSGNIMYALKSCVELLHEEIENNTKGDTSALHSGQNINVDVFVLCADVVHVRAGGNTSSSCEPCIWLCTGSRRCLLP